MVNFERDKKKKKKTAYCILTYKQRIRGFFAHKTLPQKRSYENLQKDYCFETIYTNIKMQNEGTDFF